MNSYLMTLNVYYLYGRMSQDQDEEVLTATMIRFVEQPRVKVEIGQSGQKLVGLSCLIFNAINKKFQGQKNQGSRKTY